MDSMASEGRDRAARTQLACLRVWTAVGSLIVAAAVLFVLGRISSVLTFLAVGCIVAYVASPIVNGLERRHVPRGLAAIVGVILVAVAVVLLFALLIPLFLGQVSELLSELPGRISAMSTWFAQIEQEYAIFSQISQYVEVSSLVSSLEDVLSQVVRGLISAVGTGIMPVVENIASGVFVAFLGLVLAYWLALDYPRIKEEICLVLGPRRSRDFRLMTAVVSRSVGGYLRSTAIDSVIQGSLAFVGFLLAGHPFAGVMGVISGVLNFLPVVGPSISAIIATLVALFYSPTMAFWTMVAAMLAQNITDNLIVPKINQSTMQIHPVFSLTAIMLGSALMGTMGMVVAIPFCAIVRGLFIFYYESRTGRQVVSFDGALFKGTPYHDADGRPVPACDALDTQSFSLDPQVAVEADVASATAEERPQSALAQAVERARERVRGGDKSGDEKDDADGAGDKDA